MFCLNRNRKTFYYSLYLSKVENEDAQGNKTGTYTTNYSAPVEMYANISASRGTTDTEMFGINTAYTKTIVTDNVNCPISEDTILWIDRTPDSNGESGEIKHDYAVVQIARSLNSITYAIREVSVS